MADLPDVGSFVEGCRQVVGQKIDFRFRDSARAEQ
jgi:hypothetical protein